MSETSFDVVVIGSGAGALASAVRAHDLGLKVLVIEKGDRYGGTSALSGGGIWIPNNETAAAMGDTPDQAMTYMLAATDGMVPEARLRAYVDNAPRVVRWLRDNTWLRFGSMVRYPDYYPDLPGWRSGRTMEPEAFDVNNLGEEASRLHNIEYNGLMLGRMSITSSDANKFLSRKPGWKLLGVKIMLRYWLDLPMRLKSRMDRRLTLGLAVVAALRRSMVDRGIPLWLETEFKSFITTDGKVTGIVAASHGREIRIEARHAVIVAAGGFERNQAMREKYHPTPSKTDWTVAGPANMGDGIRAGIAIGAATAYMDMAWSTPSVCTPGAGRQTGMFADRGGPGLVCVNQLGKRFVNEGANYLSFTNAMRADHAKTQACMPAWMIFDADHRQKYLAGPLMPGWLMPDKDLPANWVDTAYYKADTLEALAQKIGVDAAGLKKTVARMNDYARTGVDEEFQKGNGYDTYFGDPSVKPNPCLGPIRKAPFYALRLDPGDIGTKGGLLINEVGQVMAEDGGPIEGLYACGNSSASVMGPAYPGAGSTLGPAMVIGVLAAEEIARRAGNSEAEVHRRPQAVAG